MQLLLVKLGNELKDRDCNHAALPFSLCYDSPVLMFPLAIGLLGCQNSRHRTQGSSQVAKFILNGYFPTGVGKDTLKLYRDTIQDTRARSISDTDTRYHLNNCIRYDTCHLYLKILRYIYKFHIIDIYNAAENAYEQECLL